MTDINYTIEARIGKLRKQLKKGNIDAFIVPRADEYLGEYVSKKAERLAYITGFTGSAGQALITQDKALFITDGRYSIQSKAQIPTDIFEIEIITGKNTGNDTLLEWIKNNVSKKAKIAFDPWLHSIDNISSLKKVIENKASASLITIDSNPIDKIWENQPSDPISPVVIHPLKYAGQSHSDKISKISHKIAKNDCDAMVTIMPEEIAWLLNIRGADVPCTPLPLSFAIVNSNNSVDLFIDKRKLLPKTMKHLGENVKIHQIDKLQEYLEKLGKGNKKVMLDTARTSFAVYNILDKADANIKKHISLCQMPKATKNKVEIEGARKAHIKDGVAVTRFLYQLSKADIVANLTEITAADMLEEFRKQEENFKMPSFDTISGIGSNGAIIHYKATKETDTPLSSSNVYLVDSGGQYLEGTTDITRTIALGEVTDKVKDRFTRVLKGHIQVAMQIFEKGETGAEFDKISRSSLREIGLNYPHSLGHGVGSYLSVHEGPQGLYPNSKVELQEGMIVSNEPGYYEDGKYGIRIESLVVVTSAGTSQNNKELLKFETLTMAPIDLNMIKLELLDNDEINWLNKYHLKVRENLLPELEKKDQKVAKWLKKVTAPISTINNKNKINNSKKYNGGNNGFS